MLSLGLGGNVEQADRNVTPFFSGIGVLSGKYDQTELFVMATCEN